MFLRYMFRQNALLLLSTLMIGVGIYLLTEVVERADTFAASDAGFWLAAEYFFVKTPLIISQILPAVFLLASVIQLCLMARSRESIALQAGGVSPLMITWSLLLCGLFWGGIQLFFSQYVGTWGAERADIIWQEQVRQRERRNQVADNVWFTEGDFVVSIDQLQRDNSGSDITVYRFSPDGQRFSSILRAPSFSVQPGLWTLQEVEVLEPDAFSIRHEASVDIPLTQNPEVFFYSAQKPQQLSLWRLGDTINQLSASGSSVQSLRTAWHGKLAYAASLMVMAVLATALTTFRDNVYLAVALSLVCVFISYTLTIFGESLGQLGTLPPMLAAWGPQLLILLPSFAYLRWKS